ncbi:MAG: hypothetical protein KDB54_02635 [Solirubrobacterales bacterium]|nr:hypothetical protein [Solirubrobacterales bacterium]
MTVLPFLTYSGPLTGGRTYHSPLKVSACADNIGSLVAKDRSKEILKEIRNLREELSARLDALEARSGTSHAPGSGSALPDSADPGASLPGVPVNGPALPVTDPASINDNFELPTGGEVRVIVRPLHDLSLARVVEDALANTEGVEEASLRELRGDSATIDTKVGEGVSLITSLRRKLPVAFDVTESSSDSVTIALAQPMGGRESGVAAPTGL